MLVTDDDLASVSFVSLAVSVACNAAAECGHGSCNETSGACQCESGWSGLRCEFSGPFRGSRIVTPEQGAMINSWAKQPSSTEWELCYSTFTDSNLPSCHNWPGSGWDGCAKTFHSQCDEYAPTVTLARNSLNFTFGGYVWPHSSCNCCFFVAAGSDPYHACGAQADATWSGGEAYKGTAACFIFGLEPGLPQRFGPKASAENKYQSVGPNWWPQWGESGPYGQYDLTLGRDGSVGNHGCCNQDHTYAGVPNQICGGATNWGQTELEVWRLAD